MQNLKPLLGKTEPNCGEIHCLLPYVWNGVRLSNRNMKDPQKKCVTDKTCSNVNKKEKAPER